MSQKKIGPALAPAGRGRFVQERDDNPDERTGTARLVTDASITCNVRLFGD